MVNTEILATRVGFMYNTQILLCLSKIFPKLRQNTRVVSVNFLSEELLDFPTEYIDLKNVEYTSFRPERIDAYIVNKDEVEITYLIGFLNNHTQFYPRASFVFIGKRMDKEDLQKLSSYYVLNVYFLNTTNGNIYAFFPFPTSIYTSVHLNLSRIGDVSTCDINNFFQQMIPDVWKGGSLQVCITIAAPSCINQNEGIFPDTFNLLADVLNLTLSWRADQLAIEGFWIDHFLEMFYSNKCDVHMGYAMNEAEVLPAFTFNSAYWFVPSPLEVKKWSYAFRVFGKRSWGCWILFTSLLCLLWSFQNVLLKKEGFTMNFLFAFILIMSLFLEQSQKFSKRFVTTNILVCLIFLQAFLMNMLFKSKFPYLLIGIHYEKSSINDIEDVMNKGMTVGVPDYFLPLVKAKPEMDRYIQTHHHLCFIDNVCLRRTAFQRDLATVQVRLFYLYERNQLLDVNGRDLVVRLEPPIISGSMNPIVPRGHPLFDQLQRYLMLFWDHGFVQKINLHYSNNRGFNDMDFDLIKLGVEHIMLPLAVLVVGLSLSVVVFSFEFAKPSNLT